MAKRKVLNNSGLLAYSGEHLYHEISMTFFCWALFGTSFSCPSKPELARILRNAVVESFATHLRNVIDFVYPVRTPRSDDVIADDFFPGGRPAEFPAIPASLDRARDRAHKELAHLTTKRIAGDRPEKSWGEGSACLEDCLRVLGRFVKDASPEKLHEAVTRFVTEEAPRLARRGPKATGPSHG